MLTTLSEHLAARLEPAPRTGDLLLRDVAYGPDARHLMDVCVPEGVGPHTPAVVLVHGGAWKYGNKLWMRSIQHMLLRQGILSANINYRLARQGIRYTDQLQDVAQAVAAFRGMQVRWGGARPCMLLGESAGGHLALLHGYRHPGEVQALISLSAPTDLYSEAYRKSTYYRVSHRTFELITGASYQDAHSLPVFREASPVTQVSAVPTLVFQGGWDPIVFPAQGEALRRALAEKGVPHRFVSMPRAGHVPRLLPRSRNRLIYPAIQAFIHQYAPQAAC